MTKTRARLGRRGDFAIDLRRRRRDDEPRAVEIGRHERAARDGPTPDRSISAQPPARRRARRPGGQQLPQLGGGDRTAADEQDAAAGEVDEKGKQFREIKSPENEKGPEA